MKPNRQPDQLERALLARAQTLVNERVEQGRRASEQIHEKSRPLLLERKRREQQAAEAKAERLYRQRVQAARIQLQRELEHLRWSLVQSTLQRLPERLAAVVEDEEAYLPLLQRWLASAADAIEADELVVELNARDRLRLGENWNDFVAAAGVRKPVALSTDTLEDIGGLRVCSAERRICVDNTFEGRRAHLEQALYEIVIDRLFATTESTENKPHG